MAQKKSEFLGAFGKSFQIFKAIVDAILAAGGGDEDVARLEILAPEIAKLAIAARPKTEEAKAPYVLSYPTIGEIFELTLDGDAEENQPLQMVRDFGYQGEWKHSGPKIKGKQTRRFKLMQAGYPRNLEAVKSSLPGSALVEGQWIKAFKAAYPLNGGKCPVGIADASWVDSVDGSARFPFISNEGIICFGWVTDCRVVNQWCWLVPAE